MAKKKTTKGSAKGRKMLAALDAKVKARDGVGLGKGTIASERIARRGGTAARKRMGRVSEETISRARQVVGKLKGAKAKKKLQRAGLMEKSGMTPSGFNKTYNKSKTNPGLSNTAGKSILIRNAFGNKPGERAANRNQVSSGQTE